MTSELRQSAAPSTARKVLFVDNTPASRATGATAPPWTRRRPRVHRLAIPGILLGTDLVTFAVAVALTSRPTLKTLAVLVLILVLFQTAGLYRPRLSLSVLDDAPAIVGRSLAAGAAAMVLGGLNDGIVGTYRLLTCVIFGVLSLGARSACYGAIRWARRHGYFQQRALLLGAGTVAGRLAEILAEHREYGLVPVGMLDDDPLLGENDRPIPVLAGGGGLSRVVLEQRVDVVIVTFGSIREPMVVPLLRTCDRLACEILFVPRLYEVHTVTRDTEVLWGLPLVRLRRAPFRTGAWAAKRVSDVAISGLLLFLCIPTLVVCGLLSRWETGKVLYRQTRIGMDERPFTLLKLCTLSPTDTPEGETRWNIGTDSRVGPVGRFLRRTSLDELPQLWNVLRGDMSLVGPRPERPFFVVEFTRQYPGYTARHRVPVGLTGWAQIHGLRGDTSIADRAGFDNFYIENWSMWGDIKILLRTAHQVLRGAGR